MDKKLLAKIQNKTARIGVVGLGYVGLPLLLGANSCGYETVYGFDVDWEKIAELENNNSYISDISNQELAKREYKVSTSYRNIEFCDVIIITVPTPVKDKVFPDLCYVEGALASIKTALTHRKEASLIILESTVYPGVTRQLIDPKKFPNPIYVAFSPERVDPGSKSFNVHNIPKLVGGIGKDDTALATAFYSNMVDIVVPLESPEIAECAKVFENSFRAVNIALVNELSMVCDAMGINVHEVIRASSTKPFGFMPFHPGPGVGGHCIPLDPTYLSYISRQHAVSTRLIDTALEINEGMPRFTVDKIRKILNRRKIPLMGANILLLGMTYKKDVNDDRESPSTEVLSLLEKEGSVIKFCDPYVDDYNRVRLTIKSLKAADLVVLMVDHSHFDRNLILNHSNLILDTRNFFDTDNPKVIKL